MTLQPTKPLILAIPLEVRHEIYRYTWTVPVDFKKHLMKPYAYCDLYYWSKAYLELQVKQLHTLLSICGQMRDEVLSEYFYRTQVHFRHLFTSGRIHNSRANHYIRSSLLFASYTQHVSLTWILRRHPPPEFLREFSETIEWMLQLKQLKTVELLLVDSQLHTFHDFLDQLTAVLNDFCAFHIVFQLGTKLRNLEKIVLKLYFNRCRVELDADFLKRAPRLRYFNDVLSRSVREDLRQPEQQPTYVFDQHFGAVNLDWPLPNRI
ncbi:hypothetical protein NEUTE1DRAFT_129452 [Neurospora tetrasperma FGSC 2508]|uniref:Uncharacterized protein n=1 Tax=Neurospora tetrasperma (strain FGSC 2508 / ATCC MYA-4615 / P0657) TaxID=510951 RepID=F8ML51_NEUT8|nr:uncharacterized protein NEUTE1DRAFT_129452 [Neurospora tetrasperma FGSC 2508]EGO57526.1 hypothetical protein NEUTE1DRAFT_129452 [Neurospora tetrasperma FGSC 2508]EGZ72214.1 hypothetical protein NEUTE2DRAFT_90245 [Neurospora tetrasperma FGSC 2509]